jgi:hypothetical protein
MTYSDLTRKARRPILFVAGTAVLVAALAVALRWGGGITGRTIAGLPDAGALTTWGLPLARVAVDAGCVATVGWCVPERGVVRRPPRPLFQLREVLLHARSGAMAAGT